MPRSVCDATSLCYSQCEPNINASVCVCVYIYTHTYLSYMLTYLLYMFKYLEIKQETNVFHSQDLKHM